MGGSDGVSLETTTQQMYDWLIEHNFHVTYQSTAVYLLVHPELPGIEVRIGTVYTVVERDGREVYRTLHREFDPVLACQLLFGPVS